LIGVLPVSESSAAIGIKLPGELPEHLIVEPECREHFVLEPLSISELLDGRGSDQLKGFDVKWLRQLRAQAPLANVHDNGLWDQVFHEPPGDRLLHIQLPFSGSLITSL
jgi:hypothetical protein